MHNIYIANRPPNWSFCKKQQTIDEMLQVLDTMPMCTDERYVLINIGYNDIRNGISLDDFKALYAKLIGTCWICGFAPLVSLIMPLTSMDYKMLQPYNDFISSKYGNCVDVSNANNMAMDLMRSLAEYEYFIALFSKFKFFLYWH